MTNDTEQAETYPYVPLIDADSIVYASAGVCKPDEPVEFALYNAKRAMESILDRFDRGLSYKCYISGNGNYRKDIAVTRPYKGNRTQPKPDYYDDVREYLKETWHAIVVDGMEADDAVGIEHYTHGKGATCIVSQDKDLIQIPGAHYNYRNQEFFDVTEEQANRFFWTQMLTGDSVDNIQGVPKIGKVKAAKLLDDARSPDEYPSIVAAKYKEAYGNGWYDVFVEMGNLLYILRHSKEERWIPPTV